MAAPAAGGGSSPLRYHSSPAMLMPPPSSNKPGPEKSGGGRPGGRRGVVPPQISRGPGGIRTHIYLLARQMPVLIRLQAHSRGDGAPPPTTLELRWKDSNLQSSP